MKIHQSPPSPVSSSSIHSTISSNSSSPTTPTTTTASSSAPSRSRHGRCEGLDLLVKAVYHVAGSVVGVPYIQRRVIRRRKPALRFDNLMITPFDHPHLQENDGELCFNHEIVNQVGKKQRNSSKVVPFKSKDRRKIKSNSYELEEWSKGMEVILFYYKLVVGKA